MSEPLFHYFDDCLEDDDPRAWTSIHCTLCDVLVHAFNNETMNAWLDTGVGEVCLRCFVTDDGDVFESFERKN